MIRRIFLDWCNQLYSDWRQGIFNKVLKDPGSPSNKYIPEPFFGNPDKCSVVMLNLNPGPASSYWQSQIFLPNNEKSYTEHAIPFPYLDKNLKSLNCEGDAWWEKRNRWLNSLLPKKINEKSTDRFPFALELYPWHTKKWSSVYKKEVEEYIHQRDIFKIADLASKNSLLPNIVVAVGKAYCDILSKFGFTEIASVDNHCTCSILQNLVWPVNAKGKLINRTYKIYSSAKYNSLFFVTYAPGSNSAPSLKFKEIEKAIIDWCQNYKLSNTNTTLCQIGQKTCQIP